MSGRRLTHLHVSGEDQRSRILAFVGAYLSTHGRPPSYREIGEGVGLSSSSTVHRHIKRLLIEGRLKRYTPRQRAIHRNIIPAEKTQPHAIAQEVCRNILDRLGNATTIDDALVIYNDLADLYELLRRENI